MGHGFFFGVNSKRSNGFSKQGCLLLYLFLSTVFLRPLTRLQYPVMQTCFIKHWTIAVARRTRDSNQRTCERNISIYSRVNHQTTKSDDSSGEILCYMFSERTCPRQLTGICLKTGNIPNIFAGFVCLWRQDIRYAAKWCERERERERQRAHLYY